MPTLPLLRILFTLALFAIIAYCVPLAQQGGDPVESFTAVTGTVLPTGATTTGVPEPTPAGDLQSDGERVVRWIPNPSRRGTMGILTSCGLTLILCVCE